ncbi:Programmed cell death protein-like protein [Spironucleus salmonicida]|uniref:Programmed cell death protein-like protein n=1 Tax=Spironucleus salmonicida TaxID=348837 RepID=V6LUR8_9EUKA|nr:Programmed cell death protein-like protein [Spironucleus salmonicida]|eukprot:EST47451.1 hypothetical protein SS50377_12437 [Spironucleus salmonicida]
MSQDYKNLSLTPEQQQRFNQIDTNKSGSIEAIEVSKMYNFEFPETSAAQLLRAITNKSSLTAKDFPVFDAWMMRFYKVFGEFSNGSPYVQNVVPAIQRTKLIVGDQLVTHLVKKFGGNAQGITFGQFLSICSYILLCGKIMQNFDTQQKGCLNIDYNGLISLGLWFI